MGGIFSVLLGNLGSDLNKICDNKSSQSRISESSYLLQISLQGKEQLLPVIMFAGSTFNVMKTVSPTLWLCHHPCLPF